MFFNVTLALLTLAYPATVYFGLKHVEPRFIGLLLFCLIAFRLWQHQKQLVNHWAVLPTTLVLSVWAIAYNSDTALHLHPVLVNFSLLIVFALSLKKGPPIIERLARLTEPDLPASGIAYTRKVTILWSIFFTINGAISAYTVWLDDPKIWALYNGMISYLAIGTLFSIEWLIRQAVRSPKSV